MTDTKRKDESTAQLVEQMTGQISRLVRDELKLAEIEMKHKGAQAGTGLGLFGVTGIFLIATVSCLATAVIAGFDTALPLWAAALVSAAIFVVLAAISALVGKSQVKKAIKPVPEQTANSVKDDIQVIKESAKR